MSKKSKVKLVFKSGFAQDFLVEKLVTKFKGSRLVELTWTDMEPNILFLDVEEIVAVLKEKED